LDDKGQVVLQDGKPVYVKPDGTDLVFDAEQAFTKIGQLTGENADYRKRYTEAEAKVKAFDGIDDPEAAKKALETMQNIDQGRLLTAGKVEELKASITKTAEEKVADVLKQSKSQIDQLTQERDTFRDQLNEEKIGGGFSRSKFIQEKIAIPADMVRAAFGKAFKVEDGKTVAYGADGKPIYSRSRMGEIADFDEALEILVDQYPYKEQILKGSGASGSGAANGNGTNHGGKKVYSRSQFNALDPAAQRSAALEVSQGKAALTD
jgi:hypothetical protein